MKRHLLKLIIVFLILVALSMLGAADAKRQTDYRDLYYASIDNDKIVIYTNDEGHYLFLPSYAKDYKLSAAASELDINIIQSDNVATIFIITNHSSVEDLYENKDNSLSGRIKIIDKDGVLNYEGNLKSISGRGNTSWNSWDKKGFTIACNTNDSILYMNSGEKYALLPNASDPTLIRNDIAQSLSYDIANIYAPNNKSFVCKGEFVDLYINGEYIGNYYICPTIEIGTERIDITDLNAEMNRIYGNTNIEAIDDYHSDKARAKSIDTIPTDYTGGYILEGEYLERYEHELGLGTAIGGFISNHERCFLLKSPQIVSPAQIEYIKSYINEIESALEAEDYINPDTQRTLDDYLDIQSMAMRYITEEITANYDGAVSSEYYYKDSDSIDAKLYAGPGWDYDMSLGNYVEWMEYDKQDVLGITRLKNASTEAWWYVRLYDYEPYLNVVREIYEETARPYLVELAEQGIDNYEHKLKASASMDRIKWKEMYENLGYYSGDAESYEDLKEFLLNRIQVLDREWL